MRTTKHKWWGVMIASLISLSAYAQEVQKGDWHVIPLPQEVTTDNNAPGFSITKAVTIVYPAKNVKMKRMAQFLASYIKEITGVELAISDQATGKKEILLSLHPSISNKEGYELTTTTDRIDLKGSTEAGIFYGIQTIHKALPIIQGQRLTAVLPCGTVKDYPRFGYRGFMIDVGRHFFPVSYIKEMIDVMAMHNINYFHWHLTEDQGWRIEIKKYPKLTEVGSKRKETIISWDTKEFDGTPYGGYYTQEEAKEIVRYAAERCITVIPEVDLPGHMLGALAAYPEMGCTGGPYEVETTWGVFPDVLCGGNKRNIQFVKDVLGELMEIFPSPYIHIGGDECPKERWKECPVCQAQIKKLGLVDTEKHSKENQLQSYFMGEVEKFINKKGRKMLAWDEIVDGGLPENSTVMSWRSTKGGIEAARQHHDVIMAPYGNLYFSNPTYNKIRGINSIKRVYDFEPVPNVLTPEEQKYILGAQACIWTEWTKDSLKMEWQMMPRIAALAELQWTMPAKKNLDHFLMRLPHQLGLYTAYGLHYKDDINQVDIEMTPLEKKDTYTVTLRTFDNAPIYYTLDGMEPSISSFLYKGPFTVYGKSKIRTAALRNGKMGIVNFNYF